MPPLAREWVLSFLCWGIVAFSLGAQATIKTQNVWQGAVWPGIKDWLPWAILTPLIFRLVKRLPIERQRWKLALPVHLACGVAIVLLCQWWKVAVDIGIRQGQPMAASLKLTAPFAGPIQSGHGGLGQEQEFLGAPEAFDTLHMAIFEIPIYLMLVSGAHTLTFYRRTQDRESSLAIARAEAQKMQLQPHFLFNTLNMIAELVHEEPDKADAMLIALSGLLRLTMETAGEQ